MKKNVLLILFFIFLSACSNKDNPLDTYEKLESLVTEQKTDDIKKILSKNNKLSNEEIKKLAFISLSEVKNLNISKIFYDYGLDVNEIFSNINQKDMSHIFLEKTNLLYFSILYDSEEMFDYAILNGANFTEPCYTGGQLTYTPLQYVIEHHKSLFFRKIIDNLNSENIDKVNLIDTLYFIHNNDDIRYMLNKKEIVSYLYSNPDFPIFISSYYNETRLEEFAKKMNFSNLTFSENINYFQYALGADNTLESVKWLIKNGANPNKKMSYTDFENEEYTVKEAAWEFAHNMRFSFYDENGFFNEEEMKKDETYISFMSVIDFLSSSKTFPK